MSQLGQDRPIGLDDCMSAVPPRASIAGVIRCVAECQQRKSAYSITPSAIVSISTGRVRPHLTSFILDHPTVAAGLAISGVFDLGALRDSPHVNDKVKLSEEEIQKLSPMRRQ